MNAAGITGPVDEVAEIDVERWQATLDVNLTGALATSRAVLPAMKARGSGRIVNVISGLAHRPLSPDSAHIARAKQACCTSRG